MSLFGPFLTSADIRNGVLEHLQTWQATYLAAMERHLERDSQSLPLVRGWEMPPEITKWPETQLPALIIFVGDSVGRPRMDGDGVISVKRAVEITAVCSAKSEEMGRDFASIYSLAAAAMVMQHPSISGLAEGTTWQRVGTRILDADKRRTLAAEGNVFEIEVAGVLNARAGLAEPPEDPYDVPEFPTIDETQVEVSKP